MLAKSRPISANGAAAGSGHTPLMLKPSTAEDVSRILALCNRTGTAVVPQGGNTGMVGGQTPTMGEVLISLQRMNQIRAVARRG